MNEKPVNKKWQQQTEQQNLTKAKEVSWASLLKLRPGKYLKNSHKHTHTLTHSWKERANTAANFQCVYSIIYEPDKQQATRTNSVNQ